MYKIITALALLLLSNASLAAHCPGVADFVKLETTQNASWALKKSAKIDWRIIKQPQTVDMMSYRLIPVTSGLTVKLTSEAAKCIYRLPNMATLIVHSKKNIRMNTQSLDLRSYKVTQKTTNEEANTPTTVYTCHTSAQHPELCHWDE